MSKSHNPAIASRQMSLEGLDRLIEALLSQGYAVIAPTIRDQAIVYAEIESQQELPIGWTDVQEAGTYRLARRKDDARFGYNVGAHAWKRFLHPPQLTLWSARRVGGGFEVITPEAVPPRQALLGVRACELAAIQIQDKVFMGGVDYQDSSYAQRRNNALIIAVQCTAAGATCFCASMGTGPGVQAGYDLALTEWIDGAEHGFVVDVGSERGAALIEPLDLPAATEQRLDAAREAVTQAAGQMGRTLDMTGVHELLTANYESPRWDQVAQRCLTCANCTMVCPTCFCTTVEDTTSLNGQTAERRRRWDSCFTIDFSYIHGGSVRTTPMSRYRQWLTHKLATWQDQFGVAGCVGCGRCITWCPVGIDLTEEIKAIRALAPGGKVAPKEKAHVGA